MKKTNVKKNKATLLTAFSILVISALGSSARAQDLSGDWQGVLKGPAGGADLRLFLRINKGNNGELRAMLYSIDQPPEGLDGAAVSALTLQGDEFKFSVESFRASYQGKLSPDGKSVKGTWTGRRVLPLDFERATEATAWHFQLPQHSVSLVTVDKDVKLEVLDFGGSGRPMIFLAGLGATAHVFDKIAPTFIANYHAYGITRRGFGASSAPAPANDNYSADRLGDDVLAVMDFLKLNKPVLVGHSIAGEELSSVGSRYPEKLAGLIYLDAGYAYAYYDSARGDFSLDAIEVRNKLEQMMVGGGTQTPAELVQELLQTSLPQIEKDLRAEQEEIQARPAPPGAGPQQEAPPVVKAIFEGERKYTDIRVPILAFFAVPHDQGQAFKNDPAARSRLEAWEMARMQALTKAFETGLPSARVVRLPHANHWVFQTHEAEVLREMNAFLSRLQ